MEQEIKGIREDGMLWQGTREELEAWKEYKKQKALRFVEKGYSVEWSPDANNWMEIYLPQRTQANEPEIRATVKFFTAPSTYGIKNGRISKLSIQVRIEDIIAKVRGMPYENVETLFNYSCGPGVNRLRKNSQAKKLYDIVVEELN